MRESIGAGRGQVTEIRSEGKQRASGWSFGYGRTRPREVAAMPSAETISIAMPPELLRAVRESVDAGDYSSTSEALADAIRVWQRQRVDDAERLDAIRVRVRRSLDDPRPDLTDEDMDIDLETLGTKAREDTERA